MLLSEVLSSELSATGSVDTVRQKRRLLVKSSPKTAQRMQPNLKEDKAPKPEYHLRASQHDQSRLRNPWLQILLLFLLHS